MKVEMNVNIDAIEPKTFMGLFTTRQFLGALAGVAACAVIAVYLPVSQRIAIDIGILVGVCLYLCFTVTRYGMNIAVYFAVYLYLNVLSPHTRTYGLLEEEPVRKGKFKEHSKKPGYEDFFS